MRNNGVELFYSRMKSIFNALMARSEILAVKTGGDTSTAQIECLPEEILDDIPIYQHYGFSSVPPVGSEAISIFMGGDRTHGIIIATKDGKKHELTEGDVLIYNGDGDEVKLSRGQITIKSKSIKIDCQDVLLTGNLKAAAINSPQIAISETISLASVVEKFNKHTHNQQTGLPSEPIL